MVSIYVLKLKNNKYYVGKTTNPTYRLKDHFSEGGSAWSKKYKPITVHELRPDCSDSDEQIVTQEYMKKYGIENVRGGLGVKCLYPRKPLNLYNTLFKRMTINVINVVKQVISQVIVGQRKQQQKAKRK